MNKSKFVEIKTKYKGKYSISIDQIGLIEKVYEDSIRIYLKATTKMEDTNHLTAVEENYEDFINKINEPDYIEVITSFEDKRMTIAADQVASIEEYLGDTRIFLKVNGRTVDTKESYDDFKKRFEKARSRFCY